MVVAKDELTREGLKALFATHDIERSYLAITVGETTSQTIASSHGRHPTDRLRFTTRVGAGKRAVTHVERVEALGACSLVRCTLETGRTHQIRVHLAEIAGTPVLGDPVYGGRPRDLAVRALGETLGRQALHAEVLGFVHPRTRETLRFQTALPPDMARALAALRIGR
jgi:23S rRNA pseudouridine1911/1915/1917 synthase